MHTLDVWTSCSKSRPLLTMCTIGRSCSGWHRSLVSCWKHEQLTSLNTQHCPSAGNQPCTSHHCVILGYVKGCVAFTFYVGLLAIWSSWCSGT